MSVVDDYGRYFSHPGILRAACYPLQLENVSEANVKQMLSDCTSARLVAQYGKKYLVILNFKQQTRSKSKFPDPSEFELLIKCKSDVNQMRSESESESESESATPVPPPLEKPSPNGTNVGVDRTKFAEDNRIGMLRDWLEGMFKCPGTGCVADYEEMRLLSEVAKRPDLKHEMTSIERLRASLPDKTKFSRSIWSLLSNWQRKLDEAATYQKPYQEKSLAEKELENLKREIDKI